MADRMDMDTLVHNLECLYMEHRAMQEMLEEQIETWRPDVVHAVRATAIQNAVHTQFREVHESLESGQSAMHVVSLLAQAVNRSLLFPELP